MDEVLSNVLHMEGVRVLGSGFLLDYMHAFGVVQCMVCHGIFICMR
jgi:hypothetical protein